MEWLSFAMIALGAILYIEIGSRLVSVGVRMATKPIWPTVRVLLVLTWPLVMVYGLLKTALR
jgi:hypothetical protein